MLDCVRACVRVCMSMEPYFCDYCYATRSEYVEISCARAHGCEKSASAKLSQLIKIRVYHHSVTQASI